MTPPIPGHPAVFLDVDGTLLPISARPETSRPDPQLLHLLERLSSALHGAVALLSGRTLESLTELFHPLAIPAAGTHGLELRLADGRVQRLDVVPPAFMEARVAIDAIAQADPFLNVEDKGNAVAIHYRAAADRVGELRQSLDYLARRLGPDYHVQEGLYFLELKPARANKGTALRTFMDSAMFAGRVPVAVGDDLTDLHAFRQAELLGGCGIAVGDRIEAKWRLSDPAALFVWLEEVIRRSGAEV